MNATHRTLLVVAVAATFAAAPASAQSCASGMDTSVSQDGITFSFDASYRCGHFANGDYWVAASAPGGAVTITSITPDVAADQNG